jgi:hypothetical protein
VAGIVDRPKQWLINHLWDAQKELRVCAWLVSPWIDLTLSGNRSARAVCPLGSFADITARSRQSALPPKADIRQREWHVRYVPIADNTAPNARGLLVLRRSWNDWQLAVLSEQ